MEETYKIYCHCRNCLWSWIKELAKGKTADGFFVCPNCGCKEGKSQGTPRSVEDISKLS